MKKHPKKKAAALATNSELPVKLGADIVQMAIDEIVVDESVNIRANDVDPDTVDAMVANIKDLPPSSVFNVDGKFVLTDGIHRLFAYIKGLDKTMPVTVVGTGSMDDARDHADHANLRHGLNLTPALKKKIARRLHERHPSWSNRDLARRMGVSHPTIASWLGGDKPSGKNLPLVTSPAQPDGQVSDDVDADQEEDTEIVSPPVDPASDSPGTLSTEPSTVASMTASSPADENVSEDYALLTSLHACERKLNHLKPEGMDEERLRQIVTRTQPIADWNDGTVGRLKDRAV